jgi:uncharacterized protein
MKHRRINAGDERSFAIVLDVGDDPVDCLTTFAREQHLTAGRLTAIGAFSNATLGFFNLSRRDYDRIEVTDQAEVLSLLGDVALGPDGEAQLHVHVVLGRRDGSTVGGHLIAARVRPTLEVMLVESPGTLQRRVDPATGLALLVP